MEIPQELLTRARRWDDLKRWERRELARDLRSHGLAFREIQELIPAAQSTLSGWCRGVELTPAQSERISKERARIYRQSRIGRRRYHKNTMRIAQIMAEAQEEALDLRSDPDWLLGVIAYWAEGSKQRGQVQFSNSDPAMVLAFVRWAKSYFNLESDRFTVRVHIHSGIDPAEVARYWSELLGIPISQFRKFYVKPAGTGHRKKRLYKGTASITITKSAEIHHRLMGWIEGLRLQSLLGYTLSGPLAQSGRAGAS